MAEERNNTEHFWNVFTLSDESRWYCSRTRVSASAVPAAALGAYVVPAPDGGMSLL